MNSIQTYTVHNNNDNQLSDLLYYIRFFTIKRSNITLMMLYLNCTESQWTKKNKLILETHGCMFTQKIVIDQHID